MASKKKASPIGFDPLAWMKGGNAAKAEASIKKAAPEPEAVAATPAPVAAKPAPAPAAAKPAALAGPRAIVLGESLTMTQVVPLYNELKQALVKEKQIVLEAAGVEVVDAAGLQLLGALMHEAQATQVEVKWRDPSAVLAQGAKALGLAEKMRLPV